MSEIRVESGPGWTLYNCEWQRGPDVWGDALITDPPYSARINEGYDALKRRRDGSPVMSVGYDGFTDVDVFEFCDWWPEFIKGWIVAFTSHDLVPFFLGDLEESGLYTFAPLPAIERGSSVRINGDGPSSDSSHIVVARPRNKEFSTWGTLPGHYVGTRAPDSERKWGPTGVKPLWLMRALVRDYSRRGDTVVDPYAGSGSTLIAALMEGRKAIGFEKSAKQFKKTVHRLRSGVQFTMMGDER